MKRSLTSELLLAHILASLGIGSLLGSASACGGSTVEGSDPGDAALDGSVPNDGSSTNHEDAAVITPPPEDTGIIVKPPPREAGACKSLAIDPADTDPSVDCPVDAGYWSRLYKCLPKPPDSQTCAETYDEDCALDTYSCGLSQRGTSILCGPLAGPGNTCCYMIAGDCAVGRPFVVAGEARVAAAGNDPSWAQPLHPDTAALDRETREALADVWTQDGLTEHASIASFSRFVMQCLSVGAPADIVQSAQQACADEIEHCRIAFGFASAYAGRPVGPSRLDIGRALDESLDATGIALSVAQEGCIAETVSAILIAAARDMRAIPSYEQL